MNRACTLCSDLGKTAMCGACRDEARAFYRDPPSPSGLIRFGAVAALAALGAGWWLTKIAAGVSIAQHLHP